MALVVLLALLLAGCASSLSVAVPTSPGADQSAGQSRIDEEACEQIVGADAAREMNYQACMIARSYWTTVGVGASAFMDVYGTARPYETVRTELGACLAAGPRVGAGGIALAVVFGYGAIQGTAIQAQEVFFSCMTAKGYEVRRWRGRK
jgi:hypothetical protein